MRSAALAGALLVGGLTSQGCAAELLNGTYALPNGEPKVSATLTVVPGSGSQQMLDIAMTPIGGTAPITRYETELSKQLHVIAVSADLRDFVHEHGGAPAPGGHFRVPMTFRHAGSWYVYADGMPERLGQQVMRFNVVLGNRSAAPARPQDLKATGLTATDSFYAARFDGFGLMAGQEAQLSLHLLHHGRPAADITPFLGVAAHAVFIDAANLNYVHVHAAPAEAPDVGGTSAPMRHDVPGMKDMPGMEGMGPPLAAGAHVPPNLALHIRAPTAGTYVLWLQFNGGGKVRTVRFVVPVEPPRN